MMPQTLMNQKNRRLPIHAGMALILVLLVGIGWLCSRDMRAMIESGRWEAHTHYVIEELRELLSALRDVETGQRGFVITGDQKFLEPYREALSHLDGHLAVLRSLTRDNPRQQARMGKLEPVIRQRLAHSKQAVDLRSTQGLAAAAQLTAEGQGKRLMDEIRRQVAEAQTEEDRLLKERTAAKESDTHRTVLMLLVGGASSLAVLLLVFFLLLRELAWRQKAEKELLVHRDHLAEMIDERTRELNDANTHLREEMQERERAQKALHESEARMRGVVDTAVDGIITIDSQGVMQTVNPAALIIFGYGLEELIGRNVSMLMPEPDKSRHDQYLRNYLEPGQRKIIGIGLQVLGRRKDGATFPMELSVSEVWLGETRIFTGIVRDITDRKKAEENLLCSEQRYRSFVEASAQVVWQTNPVGEVDVEIPAWQTYTGQSFEEARGLGWMNAIRLDDHAQVSAAWSKAVQTRSLYEVEYLLRRHDGEWRSVLARGVPVIADGSVIREWIGTCIDITERKQAEEDLRQSEEKYRAIVESATEYAIFTLDNQWRVTSWNSGAQHLLGYPESEIVGQSMDQIFVEEDRRLGAPDNDRRDVLTAGRTKNERWYQRKDGSRFYGIGIMVAQHDSEGRLVGFLKILQDITERKKIEETLQQSEAQLKTIVESLSEGLIVADLDGQLVHWNRAALEMHGYTSLEECRRRLPELIESFQLWDLSGAAVPLEEWPLTRVLRGEPLHDWDLRVRRIQTERERVFSYNGMLVRDVHERPLMAVLTINDVTERKQIELELERRVAERTAQLEQSYQDLGSLNAKLEVSNRELQDFAFVASHDLQEPLRKVMAFGDMLVAQCGTGLDETGTDYLRRMQTAAKRMQTLISDLLQFSRVTSKAQPFTRLDLRQVAESVLGDLEVRLKQSGASVELGELPQIDADPTQMRQLLQNLIGNAIKFAQPETPPRVQVYAEQEEAGRLRLFVKDNGIGFEEVYLDRIFTVFQRLHERGAYEGTGIGLAICRKIAERHGGAITARSRPGEGATFIVTLPYRQNSRRSENAA